MKSALMISFGERLKKEKMKKKGEENPFSSDTEDESEEHEGDEESTSAAEDFIEAVHSEDPEALYDAFCALFDIKQNKEY